LPGITDSYRRRRSVNTWVNVIDFATISPVQKFPGEEFIPKTSWVVLNDPAAGNSHAGIIQARLFFVVEMVSVAVPGSTLYDFRAKLVVAPLGRLAALSFTSALNPETGAIETRPR